MVTLEQVEMGVTSYLDHELMPSLGNENSLQKVLIGTGIGLLLKKNFSKIEEMSQQPFIAAMGIFDENGNIDLDTLKEEVKKNIPKETGLQIDIPMVGTLTFRANDIEKVCEYITQQPSSSVM